MNILAITPRTLTPQILSLLERRNLIRTLKAPGRVARSREKNGAMQTLYCSRPQYGTHTLICIKKNSDRITLNYHPDNEEFILLDRAQSGFKPLYIVIALYKQDALKRRLKAKKLGAADFLAVRMDYNDPATCVFTMLKETVHCEVTEPGKGQGPVFFVSEPSKLHLRVFRTPGYQLTMQWSR